jgi:hypothetical protein
MKLKKILHNINILNIILIAAVAAFAAYSIFPTIEMKVKYALPSAKKMGETADTEPREPEIPSVMQYTAIVDDNLFHPERRIPPEKKDEVPLPKPEFVLYGTMISDDLSLAYLEDMKAPRNTPGRGKRQVALKKGDSLSGFILKEILTDKVTMVRGEERLIVAMNDPQKLKMRDAEAMAAQTAPATTPQSTVAVPPAQQRQKESRKAETRANRQMPAPPVTPTPAASPPQPTHQPSPAAISAAPLVRPDFKKEAAQVTPSYRPSGEGGGLLFPKR